MSIPPRHLAASSRGASACDDIGHSSLACAHIGSLRASCQVKLQTGTSEHIQDLLYFSDNPDLLRGSSIVSVLKCGAEIMQNCAGSEATYKQSAPTDQLDAFISHNWSMSRWRKFLILAFYFNMRKAILTTIIVILACLVFESMEVIAYLLHSGYHFGLGFLLSFPSFLIALLFGHEV